MAQVRILTKSFVGNTIVEEGAVIEYDGEIGSNMELVEQPKQAKKSKAEAKDEGTAEA